MHKVDVDSLLQGKQSKYALVVGVAKRAREITQTFEEEQIVLISVLVADFLGSLCKPFPNSFFILCTSSAKPSFKRLH